MADEQRYNILYKPELGPERNYRSEGQFTRETPPMIGLVPPTEPTPRDIVEELRELEELCPGLPEGLEPVGDIVTVLRRRAEVIQAETELLETIEPDPTVGSTPGTFHTEDVPKDVYIGSSIREEIPNIPGVLELLPPATNIAVTVETPKTLIQIAREGYQKDQIDLQKYFLNRMRIALQKYFQHQLALAAELGLSELDTLTRAYDGKAVTGVKDNDRHLHDTVVRLQVQRDQIARLFRKIANTDQTLMHLRNWNAAEKIRERYYAEAYGDSSTFIGSEANVLLRNGRSDYDAGYSLNLYNTYKYLDSAASITEEILDLVNTEAKAKAKLLKDGVDIFKQTEVQFQSATQRAVQAQSKDEKEAQDKAKAENENATGSQSTDKAENKKPTPEEIDKANGIKDPSPELAPNGGHYSEGHIKYLMDNGYTRQAAMKELDMLPQYAPTEDQKAEKLDEKNKSENKVTTNQAADKSQEAVGAVTGAQEGQVTTEDNEESKKIQDKIEVIDKWIAKKINGVIKKMEKDNVFTDERLSQTTVIVGGKTVKVDQSLKPTSISISDEQIYNILSVAVYVGTEIYKDNKRYWTEHENNDMSKKVQERQELRAKKNKQ